MQLHYIYAILNPWTNEHRYVGKTIDPHRRWATYRNGNSHNGELNKWVRRMKEHRLIPTFVVLDLAIGDKDASLIEKSYIHMSEGRLFNKQYYPIRNYQERKI